MSPSFFTFVSWTIFTTLFVCPFFGQNLTASNSCEVHETLAGVAFAITDLQKTPVVTEFNLMLRMLENQIESWII